MANETTATNQTPAKVSASTLAINKTTIVDVVAAKARTYIENGELNLPRDYSVNNAIKAAWLVLQTTEDKDHNKALAVCTQDSIAQALLDMIVQGLNPLKKQNYFIVYGKTLTCQRSYFGSMAVAKMVNQKVDDFAYEVVYEGDVFKYGIKNGKKTIVSHEQELQNVDKKKIVAAYCIALDKNGDPMRTDIMTIDEIHQAWRQSKTKVFDDNGNVALYSTHGKFTADMAKKTVVNRTCKAIINASSDNALLLDRINRNEDLADRAEAEAEIEELANTGDVIEIPAGDVKGQNQESDQEKAPVNEPTGAGSVQEEQRQEKRLPGF